MQQIHSTLDVVIKVTDLLSEVRRNIQDHRLTGLKRAM